VTPADYSEVTELAGNYASKEQLSMIHTRYHLARQYCRDKDVLEAACGPGRGLGYLGQTARSVTGGDLTPGLVETAARHYGDRVKVLELDAQKLPFPGASFDTVILFEAIYYLPEAGKFVSEALRVLRPHGTLVLCSANREWSEFNPSPLSVRYYSAGELRDLLTARGFSVELHAGFEASPGSPAGRAIGWVRRMAVRLRLIPGSMKWKAWLKRLFYGRLAALGPEIDTSSPVEPLVKIAEFPVRRYKVLYAIGRKPG
jgi:SAM-dependent methyltransferase